MKRTNGIIWILVLSIAIFASCSGGGGGVGGVAPASQSAGKDSVAYSVLNSAPTNTCPNGGITVYVGIDKNSNGILDLSESTSTQYVCNGTNGSNGYTALVAIVSEQSGTNCTYGGDKISIGLDTDGNGILGSSEVTSTQYICNGANGANGTNGKNGLNTLMNIVTEPVGANCAYGGQKITSGLDTNGNGSLEPSEITRTNYVCNGTPGPIGPAGPGITWVNVTTTPIQAVSNTGYLADMSSQVTITLPTSPALGDIIEVNGIGTGGWKVAQNAGQSIVTQDINNVNAIWALAPLVVDVYFSWTDGARVASSSDGTKLVAVVYGGGIYTSSDSGVTWILRLCAAAPNEYWASVASSSDGVNLVAGYQYSPASSEFLGGIYTSSDSGVTWILRPSAPNNYYNSIASSSDGTKLVAAGGGGQVYTSSDSGVTWILSEPNAYWMAVASSSDGTKLVAAQNFGGVYVSSNSGKNWTLTSAPGSGWKSLSSSSDGTKIVGANSAGEVYTLKITSAKNTTVGLTGSISGGQYDTVELQYIGNNTFDVLSSEGVLLVQ